MYDPDRVWEFTMTDEVRFGAGAVEELSSVLSTHGITSVLIVTDSGVQDAGIVDHLICTLDGIAYDVFDGVEPDPSHRVFTQAIEVAEEVQPDAIIGVGGGSAIDIAKTATVLADATGDILDYVAPPTGAGRPVPETEIHTIAIPTTAGTGSETSPVSVVSLPEEKLKVGISSRHQSPDLAIIDPTLTVSLPPEPTASAGMDALAHAIEAYTTRRFDTKPSPDNPQHRPDYGGRTVLTDTLAERSIELIASNLPTAYNVGTDLDARRNMSLASHLAGIAFTNAGLGATHAMAYPVAGEHDTRHGTTVAVLLPAVMRFNASATSTRYAEIAELFGENLSQESRRDAAESAARAVETLARDIGIPSSLAELGVTEAEIPILAERTERIQRLLVGNPRQVTKGDIAEIYADAI